MPPTPLLLPSPPLSHPGQALTDLRAARDADAARFEDALLKAKFESLEAAARAREESVQPLKAEVEGMRVRGVAGDRQPDAGVGLGVAG